MLGKYNDILKNISKQYLQRKGKIRLGLIYGTENGGSYYELKGFINELLYFLNDLDDSFIKLKEEIESADVSHDYENSYDNTITVTTGGPTMNGVSNHLPRDVRFYIKSYTNKLLNKKKEKKDFLQNFENQKISFRKFEKCQNYKNCEVITKRFIVHFDVVNGNIFDYDSFFEESFSYDLKILILFISTSDYGSFPTNCKKLETIFNEWVNDFRVDKNYLKDVFYSCVGFGNKSYGEEYFCTPTKLCDEWLHSLGAHRIYNNLELCDSENNDDCWIGWKRMCLGSFLNTLLLFLFHEDFLSRPSFYEVVPTEGSFCLKDLFAQFLEYNCERKYGTINNKDSFSIKNSQMMLIENITSEEEEGKIEEEPEINNGCMDFQEDIEDLLEEGTETVNGKKEMLTRKQREQLTKEGYKIVGSHSAVKLCRWTKSQIRGRGGCYKNTFYGIKSYQCMEATPSLACANKCVFCWRHHKNPVGVQWNWHMDNAEFLVQEFMKQHKKMIKELRGIYGIMKDRFEEGMHIQHCALSLVGEPIMYPQINSIIDELHKNGISTFLVTNAQFPEALRQLHPVTQLYLSIDASNEKSLKKIDRPLFKDFWDRYIQCIKILKQRKERTVYRFTLVKEFNMMGDELDGYASLIKLGNPDFIEIKAATFCGSSESYNLTMKNIPWFEEVVQFGLGLLKTCSYLQETYELACAHKHSCSILIAQKRFKINNQWHTWINYEKFQSLVKKGAPFDSLDYSTLTPEWALMGSKENGFNPSEVRVYTKGKYKKNPCQCID